MITTRTRSSHQREHYVGGCKPIAWFAAHLRQTEECAEHPGDDDHDTDTAWRLVATHRIEDGDTPVDADDDDDVGRQVEAEHLHEFDELAHRVAGVPLDGGGPDGICDIAEEGDDQVGGGEVQDQRVDRRLPAAHAQHLQQRGGVSDEWDDKHDAEDDRLHERHVVEDGHDVARSGAVVLPWRRRQREVGGRRCAPICRHRDGVHRRPECGQHDEQFAFDRRLHGVSRDDR